jgi:sugar phosphate isomerase/epimerase
MTGARLRYGYNSNGLAHHRLDDGLRLIADLGFDGCAVTLDHAHLDPFAPGIGAEVDRIGRLARDLGLALTIETGARFLLDPRHKHEPSLVSDDPGGRAKRIEFLSLAVQIGRDLGAEVVSIWSGVAPAGTAREESWARLADGVDEVARRAAVAGMSLGVEPEPGMLVESVDDYFELRGAVDSPTLGLTLDLGHVLLTEAEPPEAVIPRVAMVLANVHAEDMRRGAHEHLAFGLGEMDYPPLLAALTAIGYEGLVTVELSRDSHRAPEVAAAALAYLRAAEKRTA